jgi:predicted O-linked N-acetylglucosamine transferase (SPINDLY family)
MNEPGARDDTAGEATGDASAAPRLLAAGRPAEAEAVLARHCREHPDDAPAWFLLGVARHRLRRTDAALDAFHRAAELDPLDVRPRSAAGVLLADAGWIEQGLAWFRAALALRPADPRLLTNAALALESLGRLTEALECYDRAIAIFPGMGDARLGRVALLLRMARVPEAMAEADALVAAFPDEPAAWFNRAEAALAANRPAQARADCERALALDPKYVKAWIDHGIALAVLGQLGDAEDSLQRARDIDARAVAAFRNRLQLRRPAEGAPLDPRRIHLDAIWRAIERCDWHERGRRQRRFVGMLDAAAGGPQALRDRWLTFALLAIPAPTATRRRLAADVAAGVIARGGPPLPVASGRRHDARLRIGYLSPNFREHPSAYLAGPLFALHDRARCVVHGYSLRRDAGPLRRRIEAGFDTFRELSHLPDRAVAECIQADEIDILVDLAGYNDDARPEILALAPAPVRVSLLGFPGSLGPGLVDYRIADAVATAHGAADEFVEALAHLPHTHVPCDGARPGAAPARGDAGLPEAAFVFACLSNPWRIDPQVFASWMRLLAALPGAVLWLLEAPGVRDNLRAQARRAGVDGERLVFAPRVPRAEHLARLQLADLFLDTPACAAHATACDALLAGVPVLTRPGATFASRLGASIVTAAGTGELVVTSAAAYERVALQLAGDPQRRAALRARLQAREAPLFDLAARVRDLEAAYATMWARHVAGQRPASFDVVRTDGRHAG